MFKQMLKDLLLSYGPSGREDAAAACIERYAAPHADEIRRDALGNLIVRRAGTSGRRVMLSAHMDQIGLVVVDIDENGFLRVAPVGGVLPAVAAARAVVFAGGVRGVTGWENKKKTPATATMQELFVDIGERYVITCVLTFMAPLAFAMGGSRNTSDIFKGWCRMYGSMNLMLIMNIVFLKLIISAMSHMVSSGVIWDNSRVL